MYETIMRVHIDPDMNLKEYEDTDVRIVRCGDCGKSEELPDRLVCKRFGCFHHEVPADFFCADGVRRGA